MNKTSKWLLPLAAVLVVAAFFLRPQDDVVSQEGSLLLPKLAEQLDAVERVEILTPGNTVVITLVKSGDVWGLEERGGYPIKFDRLRSILRALAGLKTAEAMTRNPEYYSRLAVSDIANADSGARAVRLYNAAGEKVAGLLLGNSIFRGAGEQTYLRAEGDEQSWLVQGGLELGLSPDQWLQKDLLNTPRSQIDRVDITHPDGEVLTIIRQQNPQEGFPSYLEVQNVPEGQELLYISVGNGPAEALENLRLEDVQTADSFDWNADNIVTTRLQRKDGISIVTQAERRETKYFLAIAAEYGGDDKDLKAEAKRLNNKFNGWVFHLQPYKYQALSKRMRNMLKDE